MWAVVELFGHKSRPAWARGLKLSSEHISVESGEAVAPRVGAWIETACSQVEYLSISVAPRVGAWIETEDLYDGFILAGVAPRVGAWIETRRDWT